MQKCEKCGEKMCLLSVHKCAAVNAPDSNGITDLVVQRNKLRELLTKWVGDGHLQTF